LDALLGELTCPGSPPSASFGLLERSIVRAEAWADRLPWLRRSCLYVSLERYAVFRRFGHSPQFVLALDPKGPDSDGHAWLEFDGVPYQEPRASEFVVSYRFPA
jgi:hypothetical protein